MQLQLIRYGFLAGLSFLATVAALEWLARPPAATAAEADITDQVWQVLAEARRIVEEA